MDGGDVLAAVYEAQNETTLFISPQSHDKILSLAGEAKALLVLKLLGGSGVWV